MNRTRPHDPRPYGARSHHPDPSGGPHPHHAHSGAEPSPGRGRRGGGGRAPRGDVRSALLLLLSGEPMHGYQLMQTIADRTGGRWTPSPGAVYPALAQLEDEGLVEVTREHGRKQATITAAGRAWVEENEPADPFTAATEQNTARPDLRGLLEEVHSATRQLGRRGSDSQVAAAAEVLTAARRGLYLLLADGPEAGTDPES